MNLRDYVKGRVLVWIIIAVLTALLGWVKEARADPLPSKSGAKAQCDAHLATMDAAFQQVYGEAPDEKICIDTPAQNAWACRVHIPSGWKWCNDAGGTQWFYYDPANQCLGKPDINNRAVRGSAVFCSGGCEYRPKVNDDNSPGAINVCMMGAMYCGASAWRATGLECSTEDDPEVFDDTKDTCVTMSNGYGECVHSDGTHCKTASTGRKLCWRPGETGPRTTSDGLFGADRKVAPGAPTAPATIANPEEKNNSQTTINNNTYNSSSYSGGGGSGNPGQGDSGVPGDSNGDGQSDDGAGSPGPRPGNLYTPSGKTMAGVWGTFKNRVSNSPLVTAGDNFFSLNAGGGACPVWTKSADEWLPAMTFDFHCQGLTAQLLDWAAWVLLAVIAFFCWRVAIE